MDSSVRYELQMSNNESHFLICTGAAVTFRLSSRIEFLHAQGSAGEREPQITQIPQIFLELICGARRPKQEICLIREICGF
jgi:hypothetical protein